MSERKPAGGDRAGVVCLQPAFDALAIVCMPINTAHGVRHEGVRDRAQKLGRDIFFSDGFIQLYRRRKVRLLWASLPRRARRRWKCMWMERTRCKRVYSSSRRRNYRCRHGQRPRRYKSPLLDPAATPALRVQRIVEVTADLAMPTKANPPCHITESGKKKFKNCPKYQPDEPEFCHPGQMSEKEGNRDSENGNL